MNPPRTSGQWSLGLKLALVATPFLLLTLLAIGATLWVSWQLEGGAAAVNEAGRLRMQTYRQGCRATASPPGCGSGARCPSR